MIHSNYDVCLSKDDFIFANSREDTNDLNDLRQYCLPKYLPTGIQNESGISMYTVALLIKPNLLEIKELSLSASSCTHFNIYWIIHAQLS